VVVLLGHKVSQDLRARGGGESPRGPDVVLEGDGDAVGAARIARAASRRAKSRFPPAEPYQGLLGMTVRIGVELGIELLDAAESVLTSSTGETFFWRSSGASSSIEAKGEFRQGS